MTGFNLMQSINVCKIRTSLRINGALAFLQALTDCIRFQNPFTQNGSNFGALHRTHSRRPQSNLVACMSCMLAPVVGHRVSFPRSKEGVATPSKNLRVGFLEGLSLGFSEPWFGLLRSWGGTSQRFRFLRFTAVKLKFWGF